jgi:Zn-dependent peptidase ImmA (M78 family)
MRSRAEQAAAELLDQARREMQALGEPWDAYRIDVELIASLVLGLGVQRVPDLRVGAREYAGFLDPAAGLIAVEESHHEHRQRFSIAHEVGHYVLHYLPQPRQGEVFACTQEDMEVTALVAVPARTAHLRREMEANLFAGELLMPEPSVRAMHKVTGGRLLKLARHFHVSPQAMEIRLARLNLPYR